MKKICIIILIVFSSCSSNKMILRYLTEEENRKPDISIKINKEKYELLNVIKILRSDISKKTNSNSAYKHSNAKYLNKRDFLKLKKNYENDTLKKIWKISDFKNNKIEIIKNSFIYCKENKIQKNIFFYGFSKEYHVNKKILFYVSKSYGLGKIVFSGILVYKKVNNKWQLVDTIESDELY